MDNLSVDVIAMGADALRNVLDILMGGSRRVVGYRVCGSKLVLYWTKPSNCKDFQAGLFPLNLEQAVAMILGWLESVDYGREPDHEGDNSKGWRVYNEAWGHVDNQWEAFAAVEPVWAIHGK